MELDKFFRAEFAEHASVAEATARSLGKPFELLVARCLESLRAGGKLFFFGMLAAQAGVTIASLSLAVHKRNILWALAGLAGLAAVVPIGRLARAGGNPGLGRAGQPHDLNVESKNLVGELAHLGKSPLCDRAFAISHI